MEDTNNNEVMKIAHEDAVRMQASSRYLMGELSEAETAAFEEHFFDCRECSEDVAAGAVFAEEVRALFREQPRSLAAAIPDPSPGKGLGWFERMQRGFAFPLATAAACAVLGILFFQNVALRHEVALLSQPHQPLAVTLKVARGPETFYIPKENLFWEARFRLPSIESAAYTCEIQRGGVTIKTVTLPAPANGQPFSIHLLRSDFPSGTYIFKVHGQNTSTSSYTIDLNTE